ncbi:MAG: hypothetical protein NC081_11190 [Roseburia sp.]|nr:hypothetical protein [Roseburia sp.]
MQTNTILQQLMDLRMNSIMNGITNNDKEYQDIVRKSDVYFNELEALNLPKETRLLIDRCISEQNALGSRYGMLAYQLGFTDCRELFLEKTGYGNCYPAGGELEE